MQPTVTDLSSGSVVTINSNCVYKNISASAQVSSSPVSIYGVIVNSNSSGTLKLWDSATAAGTVVLNTFSFPAGSGVYSLHGITTGTACYATIGGTADITIAYRKA